MSHARSSFYYIYTTATNLEEAELIAADLLQAKLVACANITPSVISMYWWEGKIHKSAETSIVMKTTEKNKKRVIERIKSLHSYENPAIVALPIADGSDDYLKWIKQVTF